VKRIIWAYVILALLVSNSVTGLITFYYVHKQKVPAIYITHSKVNLNSLIEKVGVQLTPEQKESLAEELKRK